MYTMLHVDEVFSYQKMYRDALPSYLCSISLPTNVLGAIIGSRDISLDSCEICVIVRNQFEES